MIDSVKLLPANSKQIELMTHSGKILGNRPFTLIDDVCSVKPYILALNAQTIYNTITSFAKLFECRCDGRPKRVEFISYSITGEASI